MDYYTTKEFGKYKYSKLKVNSGKQPFSRSSNNWGKMDKARGLRKKADRHGRHRIRGFIRSKFAHDQVQGLESLPQSTTSIQHARFGGSRSWITNRREYKGGKFIYRHYPTSDYNSYWTKKWMFDPEKLEWYILVKTDYCSKRELESMNLLHKIEQ
jgi:hypothetical protein